MFALITEHGTLQLVMGGAVPNAITIPTDLVHLANLPDRLVWTGETLADAATIANWWIGPDGTRRAYKGGEDWIAVAAAWDQRIEPDGSGGWRVADLLAAAKARRKAAIDAQAEAERLRWITPGAGQAMTYARKVEQAKAALAATDPQAEDYPMLAASIGIDGADLLGVANTVIAMDAAWEQIGAAIEMVRLGSKKAVDLAEDVAAVEAIVVAWPAP